MEVDNSRSLGVRGVEGGLVDPLLLMKVEKYLNGCISRILTSIWTDNGVEIRDYMLFV